MSNPGRTWFRSLDIDGCPERVDLRRLGNYSLGLAEEVVIGEHMKEEKEGLSRREFAKAAAWTTAAVLVPSELLSQQQNPAPEAAKEGTTPAPAKLSPESQAEADTAYEMLMRKYGKRFSEEQKADIKRLVNQQQGALDKLRAAVVTNADEPATVFQIYTGEVQR